MDIRPEMNKDNGYRRLLAPIIINVFAIIILILGVACFFGVSILDEQTLGISNVLAGVYCIITYAFLSAIATAVEELHLQTFLNKYYGEEAVNYHMQSLQKLQCIEWILQQHYYPQQVPYAPGSQMSPSQYEQQEEKNQPVQQDIHQPKQAQYYQMDTSEDASNEYKAQFKRPPSKKKENSPKET